MRGERALYAQNVCQMEYDHDDKKDSVSVNELAYIGGDFKKMEISITQLCDLDPMLDDAKILARVINVIGTIVSISDAIPFNYARVDKIRRTVILEDYELHISSSSGSSTPPSYSSGTSTRPSYSPRSSRSAQNLKKAECSNCKFLAEKIKTLEAKIKILEGALEMERHPEKHILDSVAILHEVYNEMGKLSME
ncbi:hypothetical protein Tco_0122980 [Tanacetum coccineum]